MTIIRICPRCCGEGYRTTPPYNVQYPEQPFISREHTKCSQCKGVGYLGLNYNILKDHINL